MTKNSCENLTLYLTTEQAAQRLGVTKQTLEQWRMNKKGPDYIQIGGKKVGYLVEDLIKYLENRRIKLDDTE